MTGDTQSKANGSKPLKRERVEKSGIKESTKKRKMIVTIEEQPDPRERRRERNRLLARRTRLKAKNQMADLKNVAEVLQKENEKLRRYCRQLVFPVQKASMLSRENIVLPAGVLGIVQNVLRTTNPGEIQRHSFSIMSSVSSRLPIVYASDGYVRMFGYEREEVLGKKGLFITEPNPDAAVDPKVPVIRRALVGGVDCNETVMAYRKDGKKLLSSARATNMKDQAGKTFLVLIVYRTESTDQGLLQQRERAKCMTGMFIDVFSGKTSLPPKNNGTAFKFSPLYYNQRLQDNYLQNSAKIPTTSATENPASGSNSQFSTTEEETNDSDDVSDKKFDTNYTMANITIQDWDQCVAGCMDNESVDSWRALADLPVRSDKSIDFDSCCFSR